MQSATLNQLTHDLDIAGVQQNIIGSLRSTLRTKKAVNF